MELPESFVSRMKELLGDEYEQFEKALETEPPVSIRINSFKYDKPLNHQPVPWSRNSYYLKERQQFTFDPLFHTGMYYVQEASSMFLDRVISQYIQEPVRYLDLCAAPGGKTTLAISALPEGSLIVSNEIERKRAQVLAENVTKWGSSNTLVLNNRASDFENLTDYFDVILTDVPCSGEGMFRKDENAITEWSESNVRNCVSRQKEIIDSINNALRPGGYLIYSTCTYNVEENERMIKYIAEEIGAEVLPVDVLPEWGIHKPLEGDLPVYRFMPHTTTGEGLFMAVLKKNGDSENGADEILSAESRKNKKGKPVKTDTKQQAQYISLVKEWLENANNYEFQMINDTLRAYPKSYSDDMTLFSSKFKTLKSGIEIATLKGKDLIPSHELAMSLDLNREHFNSFEADYDTAIKFLRRESIVLDENTEKGYVLITYKNMPLGWVKNIGNRTNNLYPHEWRIRSTYIPREDMSQIF